MEEDLKILEEYLKKLQFAELKEIVAKKDICKVIEYEQLQAIEKLISRNKELTEKLESIIDLYKREKEKNKKLERLNTAYKNNYYSKVLKEERKNSKLLKNYISKDKIKEKIEELTNIINKKEEETDGLCITIGEDIARKYLIRLLQEGDE